MKTKKVLFFLMIATLLGGCRTSKNMTIDNSTVDSLNLERYLGKWYEIARFPHSFEEGLVGVTATYSLRDDGKIKVVNEGYVDTLDGKKKSSVGKAKRTNPKAEPAKLKVSFFLFFYADYYVMELDHENYQWAMIGSSSPKYFWILSRTPELSDDVYTMLLNRAKERGYDLSQLIKVPQKGNS